MSDEVIIVDYNPAWPMRYEEEKARILAVIGDYLEDIQHVGSTSIPGLAAKPAIDILTVVRDISLVECCIQPLAVIEYQYQGERGIPGRHFFRKPVDISKTGRTHHLHMVERGHRQQSLQPLFRDYMRRHPEAVQQYEALKRELAVKYSMDRGAYTEAKGPFIESIICAAVEEALGEYKKE